MTYLVWAQLFRKKTRTVLTLLSVFVAFLLFGLLEAVTTAFESGADSADGIVDSLVEGNECISEGGLTDKDHALARRIDEVAGG